MTLKNEIEMVGVWHEIDDLRQKTVAELQIRNLEVFGEASRSNHKQFLRPDPATLVPDYSLKQFTPPPASIPPD